MRLPFTREQFMMVFENYNTTIFPIQIFLFLIGCMMIFLIKKHYKFIGYLLGCLWIWVGAVYHLIFFTQINKAAYIFGAAFIFQGIIFIVLTYRSLLIFEYTNSTANRISSFFVLFGFVLYPVIGWIMEKDIGRSITLGLPCPTTIVTFGLLGLQSGFVKKRYLIIPLVWSLIGLFAAILMGIYQDVVMPIAALYTWIVCNKPKHPHSYF